ncbi:MAG TPA: M28 family peptidase [Planctomycetes bacterium]|nr:M28 family peptidase [Planctomycetota bacterium]HIL52665.1 M28 family peptidase [Planctomycetota bacterium]
MSVKRLLRLFGVWAGLCAPLAAQVTPAILRADLEEHVRFLASDELAGRKAGSPESVAVAHYLAEALAECGLEPAGDDKSFLQLVPFQRERYSALPELRLLAAQERNATHGADFVVRQGSPGGEVQVVLVRVAEDLPDEADAETCLCFVAVHRSRARSWLRKAGFSHGRGFGLVLSPARRESPANPEPPAVGRLHLPPQTQETSVAWLEYGEEFGALIVAAVEEEGRASLAFDLHWELQPRPSFNVVGRLPGVASAARPELAREAVVISAHHDHLGIRAIPGAGETADTIFNGADDDASGVACVLELAAACAAGPAPARELIFLLATAEEIGIVGTTYYLDHPSTPLEETVLNLNFEMLGRPDESIGGSGNLWLTGGARTNLLAAFEEAKLDIFDDPHPQQNFFQRSDNIVFVRRGIVGQTLSSYNLHKDYHTPRDDADSLDYAHLEAATKVAFEALSLVATGSLDPIWLPGQQPGQRR